MNFASNLASTLEDKDNPVLDFSFLTVHTLCNITISARDVSSLIKSLDTTKATCPNIILVVVLKNLRPELSQILIKLFNRCLEGETFARSMKGVSYMLSLQECR